MGEETAGKMNEFYEETPSTGIEFVDRVKIALEVEGRDSLMVSTMEGEVAAQRPVHGGAVVAQVQALQPSATVF